MLGELLPSAPVFLISVFDAFEVLIYIEFKQTNTEKIGDADLVLSSC